MARSLEEVVLSSQVSRALLEVTVAPLTTRSPTSLTTLTVQRKTVCLSLDLHTIILFDMCTGSAAVSYSRKLIVSECESSLYAALVEWIRDRGYALRSIIELYNPEDIPALPSQARFYAFVFSATA
jgi:hypothetical protein